MQLLLAHSTNLTIFCHNAHITTTKILFKNTKAATSKRLRLYVVAREERLELPTLGFGDRCSTN